MLFSKNVIFLSLEECGIEKHFFCVILIFFKIQYISKIEHFHLYFIFQVLKKIKNLAFTLNIETTAKSISASTLPSSLSLPLLLSLHPPRLDYNAAPSPTAIPRGTSSSSPANSNEISSCNPSFRGKTRFAAVAAASESREKETIEEEEAAARCRAHYRRKKGVSF